MFQLRCTVRNCHQLLGLNPGGLTCSKGHHFDRAKAGYWNLLQPQDRKSANPGDCDEAVAARSRWLERGFMVGLIDTLRPWLAESASVGVPQSLDLGCGEGTFGHALFENEADGFCGIDLSKKAIRLAARRWPAATWVLANADRTLPAADASLHRVISLFGRRPATEIYRVLAPGGICMVAVPGEDDLLELREHVQQAGHRRSRWEAVVDELQQVGLKLLQHEFWRHQVQLDADGISDAMAMTYRGVRNAQQSRLAELSSMEVTLSADLLLFRVG